MLILLALVVAIVAAVVFLDVGATRTLVRATVVESRFQAERANDGRTLTTVVTDDGFVLLDSTLIIDYALKVLAGGKTLGPADPRLVGLDVRLKGLGLAACEKAVQIVYERQLRPTEKQHQPWLDRVAGQLKAALSSIEADIGGADWLLGPPPSEAGITLTVAGTFIAALVPDAVSLADYPRLAALTAAAERTALFRAWPHE